MLGVRTGKVTPLAPILDTALSTSLQTRLVVTSFMRKKMYVLPMVSHLRHPLGTDESCGLKKIVEEDRREQSQMTNLHMC